MPRGDAVQQVPTVEEQMATFKGFSTTNGEVSRGEPTNEEKDRLAADAAHKAQGKAAAAAANDKTRKTSVAEATAEGEGEEEIPADETPEAKAEREAKTTKTRSANDRIGKAVGKQRAAERALATEREERARERGAFEARLEALEKKGLTGAKGDDKDEAVDPLAPRPQDFEYGELDVKYIRALARYEAKQEVLAAQNDQQTKTQTAAQKAAQAEFQKAKTAFEKAGNAKYADFDEVVVQSMTLPKDDPDFWPVSPTVGELILTSDVGRDVAYHLATHPDEAKDIFGQSAARQAAWFGRKEAEFSSESQDAGGEGEGGEADPDKKAKPAAKVTQAPPPPKNRAKGAGGKTQASPDTQDFASFEALAMAAQK